MHAPSRVDFWKCVFFFFCGACGTYSTAPLRIYIGVPQWSIRGRCGVKSARLAACVYKLEKQRRNCWCRRVGFITRQVSEATDNLKKTSDLDSGLQHALALVLPVVPRRKCVLDLWVEEATGMLVAVTRMRGVKGDPRGFQVNTRKKERVECASLHRTSLKEVHLTSPYLLFSPEPVE